jgi:clan AA aspartic protease (TIGR02281 family)
LGRLIGGLLLFVAGAAAGAVTVYWHLQRAPDVPVAATVPLPAPAAPAATQRGDGTVWVTLESGLRSQRALGIVVRDPAVVMLRFEDFIRCERGWWRGVDGRRHELGPAVALDLELGLLAFAATDAPRDGLDLSAEDGALFLGRDVALTTDTRMAAAFVDSAAIELGLNDYRYYLKSDASVDQKVAAVTLAQTGELVGMATRSDESERWLAIDAGTLRDFLAQPLTQPVTTLAQFSDVVFSQPIGLAVEFDRLAARGQWRKAMSRGVALLEADPARMDASRQATLYLCVAQRVRGLVAADRQNDAVSLLESSVRQLGANEELLRLAAALIAKARASQRAAVDYLVDLNGRGSAYFGIDRQALKKVTREQVKAYVTSSDIPQTVAISLLGELLASDNDYAVYHRLLGTLLFDAGRYADAEFHLQRAVALDPQYAAEVARELATSRQRRSVGALVEAPLQASGNALYVNARLNGSDRTFRLLLDTGATYSAINTATLLRLGLNDIFARGAPPIELETANGRIFAPSFTLNSIDVNGAVVQQVPVVLLEDMGPLDGLLGLSFLQHFDVQIDQRDNKLLLSPR